MSNNGSLSDFLSKCNIARQYNYTFKLSESHTKIFPINIKIINIILLFLKFGYK